MLGKCSDTKRNAWLFGYTGGDSGKGVGGNFGTLRVLGDEVTQGLPINRYAADVSSLQLLAVSPATATRTV